jgi:hypothetical protein
MNPKKLFFAFLAAFVFIFLYEWVFHAVLLKSSYMEIPVLWRAETDFQTHFPLLVLGQAVMAFFFTMIFASGFTGGAGAGGGVKLGIMVGFFGVGANLIQYAVQPLSAQILISWCVGGLLEFAFVGAIVGAIYRPSSPSAG